MASCGECPVVPHREVELGGLLSTGWGRARWVWSHLCLALGVKATRMVSVMGSIYPGGWKIESPAGAGGPVTRDLVGGSLGTVLARGPREGLGTAGPSMYVGVLLLRDLICGQDSILRKPSSEDSGKGVFWHSAGTFWGCGLQA